MSEMLMTSINEGVAREEWFEAVEDDNVEMVKKLLMSKPKRQQQRTTTTSVDGKVQVGEEQDRIGDDGDGDGIVNQVDERGNTALHYAAYYCRKRIFQFLLEIGANINCVNNSGETILHLGPFASNANQDYLDIVDLLFEHSNNNKADKEKIQLDLGTKREGNTALHYAARRGHAMIVQSLVVNNAKVNVQNLRGETALLWAAKNGYIDTATILLKNKADPNISNDYGWTALHAAAAYGHEEAVKLLLDYNADISQKDVDGETALDVAKETNRVTITQLLKVQKYISDENNNIAQTERSIELRDIIHDMVRFPRYKYDFQLIFQVNPEIGHWKDKEGRTVLQVACRACRQVTLFLGRYDLETTPKYESSTCQVYFALDYGHHDESKSSSSKNSKSDDSSINTNDDEEAISVAMKFMLERQNYLNEIQVRRDPDYFKARLDPRYVTVDYETYNADDDLHYATIAKLWKKYKYCIVLERGDRNLLEAIHAENLLDKPLEAKSILLQIAKCLKYLHSSECVHRDIKPRNILRQADNKNWKLIDFDASSKAGHSNGRIPSSAYAPPELLRHNMLQTASDVVILADKSVDVWSFGITMYEILSGKPFFFSDVRDNLINQRDLLDTTDESIQRRLRHDIQDTAARALLADALKVDANQRLTMSRIVDHAFFKSNIGSIPKDLVFVSYRRQDSSKYAEIIAGALTEALGEGSVFFDKSSIDIGQEWPKRIQNGLDRCRYLLALIGPKWLTASATSNNRKGQRRIDEPGDWVRKEIERGLQNEHTKVIPVLLDDATLPTSDDLPTEIASLTSWQCYNLRNDNWADDLAMLTSKIIQDLSSMTPR